jgi:hypothetical protein
MIASLKKIRVADGYNTDLGKNVTFGPPPDAAEYDRESIYCYPVSRQIETANQRWTHRVTWEVVAVKFAKDAEAAIAQVEADIWKALSTLEGTDHIDPLSVDYEIQTAGKQAVSVTVKVDLLTRTGRFKLN